MRNFFHKTFRRISVVMTLTAVLVLFSCDAENTYTNHRCYFIFNTTYHQSPILMASVTGDDGFCLVYKGVHQEVEKVFVEKYGSSDPYSPYAYTTSVEPKVSELVIGWDNGLLIGYSESEKNIGNNPVIAYDRHCPKCEDNAKGLLQWNGSSRSVKCPVCKTEYNLTFTGNGLTRYPAAYLESGYGTIVRVVN